MLKKILKNKTPQHNTAELLNTDKRYIWHPFTQMKDWIENDQVIIERGEGSYVIDTEGNKYIDGVSSLWVTVHGHNHPYINKAITKQLGKISHTTFLGLSNVPAIKLTEKLIKLLPPKLTRVFYSDNGSTSVEIALKIAFQYWQQHSNSKFKSKKKFITFKNAYHGDTIGSVSLGGMDLFHKIYKPLLFETIQAPYPNALANGISKQASEENSLKELTKILKSSHKDVAGIVIEPLMQGAAGMLDTTTNYLKKVKALAKEHNVLLIVDEVATGFGRTGALFAIDKAEICPDIICMSKGITGGYLPLAATVTSEEIFNNFLGEYSDYKAFYHGHTYTANPLAAAAAIANIELFEKDKLLEKLQEKIYYLIQGLKEIEKLSHVAEIRQVGFMVGIELYADVQNKKPYPPEKRIGHKVILEGRKRGIMIRPLGDVIVLMPPLSISLKELSTLLNTTKDCIKKITNG